MENEKNDLVVIKEVISIEDKEAKQFNEPKIVENKIQAIREFMTLCNDDKFPFKQFPDSFRLVKLGTFNFSTGKFENQYEVLLEAKKVVK